VGGIPTLDETLGFLRAQGSELPPDPNQWGGDTDEQDGTIPQLSGGEVMAESEEEVE
jgi:hypothetical protein